MRNTYFAGVCIVILLLVGAYIVSAVGVKPPKNTKHSTPIAPTREASTKPSQPTSYEKLLTKYLQNIGKLENLKEEMGISDEQNKRRSRLAAAEQLNKNEAKMLDDLREWGRRNVGLDTPDETYTANKVIAESDASARMFSALIDEQLINPRLVLAYLTRQRAYLNRAWINVIRKVAANTHKGTDIHVNCAYLLYQAGIDKELYRAELEQWVLGVDKFRSLAIMRALFFDTDRRTGEPIAVSSLENKKLCQTILQANNDPEERYVCAEYLFGLGDATQAESICIELLSRRYKGFDDVDKHPGPEEDGPLYRARQYALEFMFYKLRNERVFKVIYDLSRRPMDEEIKAAKGQMPAGWVIYDAYSTARLELGFAQSLIWKVSHDAK